MISRDDLRKSRAYLDSLSPEKYHELVQMVATDDELNAEFKKRYEQTAAEMEAEGEVMTTLYALGRAKDGEPFTLVMVAMPEGIPNETKELHDKYEMGIGVQLAEDRKFNMVMLFSISEAWVIKETEDGAEMPANFGADPRRQEGLICVGGTIDGRSVAARWMVKREEEKVTLTDAVIEPYEYGKKEQHTWPMIRRIFQGYRMARASQEVR